MKESRPSAFSRRRGPRLVALFVWCGLLGGGYWYAWQYDLTPFGGRATVGGLHDEQRFGTFDLPRVLRGMAAGALSGQPANRGGRVRVRSAVLGTLLVVLGSNLSASVAYVVGRYVGGRLLDTERAAGVVRRYASGYAKTASSPCC